MFPDTGCTSAAACGLLTCCSVPLLPAGRPAALSLEQQCRALDAWFTVVASATLPLAVLAALERRCRKRLYHRQAAGHWTADGARRPPRLEPAACFLLSCVAFAAASLAVSVF